MSTEKAVRALHEALPTGIELTHAFRAEPRLRRQLFTIFFIGLIFAHFRRGPRAYAVGLTADTLFLLPLPRQTDAGVTTIPRAELSRLSVKRGLLRAKITIDTGSAHYRLRVPGVAARGEAREALTALAQFGVTPQQPAQHRALPAAPVANSAGGLAGGGVARSASAGPGMAPTPSADQQCRLTIVAGEYAGQSYPLTGALTRIGRRTTNDIVLPDRGISGSHACIERTQVGRYRVSDSGSANGTMLNGKPLSEPSELKANDLLLLGTTSLRFESSS